jgi:hypothetical protein
MSIFLTVLLNLMLVGSMLAFVACSVLLTLQTDDRFERLIRFGALFAGAMIVIGANAAGLSFAEFIVEAVSTNRPAGAAAKIVAAAVPAGLGVGLGCYLTNSMRRNRNVAIRVMALVGMLAATQFAEIYATAFTEHGPNVGAAAIPNLAFVVGIILWLVLNYDPNKRTTRIQLRANLRLGAQRATTPAGGSSDDDTAASLLPPQP